MPDPQAPLDRHRALARLASHPALPDLLPTLPPQTLTRLYQAVGIHDAGSLMAATPPALLAQALDEAVWREAPKAVWRDAPGGAAFDADVFVDWLEVWLDAGDAIAAERLVALDEDTLNLAFAELLRVEDSHISAFYREASEVDEVDGVDGAGEFLDPGAGTAWFGRFVVTARLEDEWELVQAALLALWEHDPDALLALLERLSVAAAHVSRSARRRLHGDAAAARERKRERQGFVGVESARRFLGMARTLPPAALIGMTDYDNESRRHLRDLLRTGPAHAKSDTTATSGEPTAADKTGAVAGATGAAAGGTGTVAGGTGAAEEVMGLLYLSGITDPAAGASPVPPGGRLRGPAAAERLVLERRLETLARDEPVRLQQAAAELAYLANVLRTLPAVAAGSPASDTDQQARTLALATANLGLELLEIRGTTVRPGIAPGLIQPFLLAWRVLTELPERLARSLDEGLAADATQARLARRPWLAGEVDGSLTDLRRALAAEDFAAAGEALGILSLVFDSDACRAAVHLLAVPPAYPAALDGAAHTGARPLRTRDDLLRVQALLDGLRHGSGLVVQAANSVT